MSQPSILRQVLPTARQAGEEYATFDDLVQAEDTPSYDVRVPWWVDRDGRARLIRVRGLSVEDEAAIERAGRIAAARYRKEHPYDDRPPTSDWRAEYEEVLQRGVVQPRIDRERARALLRKNARAIDDLVRFIRVLNSLSHESIEALVAAEANLPPASDPAAAGADGGMGDGAGNDAAADGDLGSESPGSL